MDHTPARLPTEPAARPSTDEFSLSTDQPVGFWGQVSWSHQRKRIRRFIMHTVLGADDTPHRIAWGFAIGMFIAFTPTFPFQMGLIFLTSWALGANKLVGVPLAWLTNPLTMGPIYYACYVLGCHMLLVPVGDVHFGEALAAATPQEQFKLFMDEVWRIFWPLLVGCTAVGLVLAVPSYFVVKQAVIRHRRRVAEKRLRLSGQFPVPDGPKQV